MQKNNATELYFEEKDIEGFIEKIEKLYTDNEIGTMLKRLKKSAITMISQAQAETMIKKRDMSLIEDQTPTF